MIDKYKKSSEIKLQQFKFNYSHIRRVVRDNNITLKQTRLRHVSVTRYIKPVNINNQLKTFLQKDKIIFVQTKLG